MRLYDSILAFSLRSLTSPALLPQMRQVTQQLQAYVPIVQKALIASQPVIGGIHNAAMIARQFQETMDGMAAQVRRLSRVVLLLHF